MKRFFSIESLRKAGGLLGYQDQAPSHLLCHIPLCLVDQTLHENTRFSRLRDNTVSTVLVTAFCDLPDYPK